MDTPQQDTFAKTCKLEVGIYKRKQESNKERNHAFVQESDQEKKEKNDDDQEKKKENTLSAKKKERKQELDQENKLPISRPIKKQF